MRSVPLLSAEDVAPDASLSTHGADALPGLLAPLLVALTALGRQLAPMAKGDVKAALDDLTQRYKDHIPKPEGV